jgi:hypothetical protein
MDTVDINNNTVQKYRRYLIFSRAIYVQNIYRKYIVPTLGCIFLFTFCPHIMHVF